MSAVMTWGQGAGGASGRTIRPWRACHQLSADGVAESRSRRLPSSSARRRSRSRECSRGAPGGLWAGSCSSIRASVAGGGNGASSAERVPTTTRLRPREAANQARRRSASVTPLSSRGASSRRAQRAAASRSGAMRSAAPGSRSRHSTSRSSRRSSVQSSGARGGPGAGAAGGDTVSAAPPRGGGGSSESRVEPHDDRLSPAAQRPSSSAASESTGTGSTARCSGFSPAGSPSRSPTTTPIRARPWSGALTRCPRATTRPEGTT